MSFYYRFLWTTWFKIGKLPLVSVQLRPAVTRIKAFPQKPKRLVDSLDWHSRPWERLRKFQGSSQEDVSPSHQPVEFCLSLSPYYLGFPELWHLSVMILYTYRTMNYGVFMMERMNQTRYTACRRPLRTKYMAWILLCFGIVFPLVFTIHVPTRLFSTHFHWFSRFLIAAPLRFTTKIGIFWRRKLLSFRHLHLQNSLKFFQKFFWCLCINHVSKFKER